MTRRLPTRTAPHAFDAQKRQGVPLEPATTDAVDSIAAEMKTSRPDLIQIILRESLETNAYLPVRTIDEESETDGSAYASSSVITGSVL
ncbi:hypothetical protein [Mesorhizobium sp. M1365]|uniref:hypothetical protein n=1 Tax=Mesorhizobium sp. M1365 TaxID=2957090 RepID=UPI00333DBF03